MVTAWRRLLAAAVVPLVLAGCTSGAGPPGAGTRTAGRPAGSASAAPGGHRGLSAVRHVWVIELENRGYAQSFGTPSADPYLARTLPRMGALLENYYAIGHASADNYIAQVSGQAPDLGTQADCPLWIRFAGHVVAGPYHQVLGEGCVYPAAVPTLGNQLSAAGRSWAAYLQDMGNDPHRDDTVSTARGPACGHPAAWSADRTRHAERDDQYAARHDGFAFFRSVTANPAFCAAHILSFRPLPGGLAQADRFLAHWVPVIMAAPAYRDGGLIVVTFDEGSDAAACCGESSGLGPSHPNVPLPGKTGPGGGRIGAVLLSPLIRPGIVSTVPYNHYSLLRTIEDIFGLPHLGDAAMAQARSFGADVFG
jgi:hypothetical protein